MIRQLTRYAIQVDLVVDITDSDTGLRDIARLHRLATERRTALVNAWLAYPKRLMLTGQDGSSEGYSTSCRVRSSICAVRLSLSC